MPVLYRKWRPKTFDELIGQRAAADTLRRQVAAGKPAHAYLFCGTRGTGKTTSARLLAKAVNCLDPQDGNPCCKCDICRGIEDESLLDVTEIDAASNSGVDNIRELREEAHFTPVAARYRVYIIDETHMLSQGAFNALLKILEEPPAHVIFILATTELHKVPATIVSRCQRFDFKRIDSETIAGRLLHIARQEDLGLTDDAALLLARLADGSMRDALSLLDLAATLGGELDTETVTARIGLVGREHLFELAGAAAAGDTAGVLEAARGLWKKSVDYQRLCEQLLAFCRDIMVAGAVAEPGELIACLPDELERIRSLAVRMGQSGVLARMTTLQEALARMGRGADRRTELETVLVKIADPRLQTAPEALLARVEKLEGAGQASGGGAGAPGLLLRLEALEKRLERSCETAPATPPDLLSRLETLERWLERYRLLTGARGDGNAGEEPPELLLRLEILERWLERYQAVTGALSGAEPPELLRRLETLEKWLERYQALAGAQGENDAPTLLLRLETLEKWLESYRSATGEGAAAPPDLLRRVETIERWVAQYQAATGAPPRQADARAATPVKHGPEIAPGHIAKIPTVPFAQWPKVLEVLKKKNLALYGTLIDAKAYIGDDLLLVDAGEGSMFAAMVRGDSYAKESLRGACEEVTGQKYRLGPYRPEKYEVTPDTAGKLDELLKKASELGVNVDVK